MFTGPARIGEILDWSLRLLPRTLQPILPYLLASACLGGTSYFIFHSLRGVSTVTPPFLYQHFIIAIIAGIALFLIHLLLAIYIYPIATVLGGDSWLGKEMRFEEARSQFTFALLIRIFLQWMALGLGFVVLFAVPFGLIAGFQAAGLPFVGFGIGLPLLALPVLFWLNRILAPTILILESCGVRQSFRRSKFLMRHRPGRWWFSPHTPKARVTALLVLNYIVALFPEGLNQGGLAFLTAAWGPAPNICALIMITSSTALTLAVAIFVSLCHVGLYYDLRSRAEAFDLTEDLKGVIR